MKSPPSAWSITMPDGETMPDSESAAAAEIRVARRRGT